MTIRIQLYCIVRPVCFLYVHKSGWIAKLTFEEYKVGRFLGWKMKIAVKHYEVYSLIYQANWVSCWINWYWILIFIVAIGQTKSSWDVESAASTIINKFWCTIVSKILSFHYFLSFPCCFLHWFVLFFLPDLLYNYMRYKHFPYKYKPIHNTSNI